MTVTSFVPTLSSGPASTGPASTGPASGKGSAGKSGKAEAAGKHSPDDADASATGLDGFMATLSTALAAVAPVAPATDGSATLTVALPGGGPSTVSTTNPVADAPLPGAPLPGAPLPGAPLPGAPLPGAPLPGAPLPGATPPTAAPPSGGEPSTVPTTSPVGQSPLAAAPRVGGEQPTVQTSQTVDTSPLQQRPGHPTDATAAAGGTSLDATAAGELPPSAAPTVDTAPLPVTAVDGSGATSVTVTGGAPIDMAAGGSSEKTTAVLRQVFPEVTRVATQAGPGTHRLSITLHPEDLGEVKVTLVVRAGSVHVSMTAQSGAAHDALLQGAPELHRLLEVTGGDARVVVRDTSAAAASTSTTDQRGSEGRGQQSAYADQTGDSGDPRNPDRNPGRDPSRTTSGAPADEPTSPRGPRPGSPTGASQTGTPVHPGRLDRLM